MDTAHQQLGGPLVVIWDNLTTHVSAAMVELFAARDWLTGLSGCSTGPGSSTGSSPAPGST